MDQHDSLPDSRTLHPGSRLGRLIAGAAVAFGAGGVLCAAGGLVGPSLLAVAGAALLVPVSGLVATLLRHRRPGGEGSDPKPGIWTDRRASWAETLIGIAVAVAVVAAAAVPLALRPGLSLSSDAALFIAGILFVGAFASLVLERTLDAVPEAVLPEARRLQSLVRVPLLALAVCGAAALLIATGYGWPRWAVLAASLYVAAVGVEIGLRAFASLFLPASAVERGVAASWTASLIASRADLGRLGTKVKAEFGINLSRSWALGFLRRAALPVTFCLALAFWASTGVTILPLDQRGIYERLGVPARVLGAGVHFGLPWPFGAVRLVENGVVHELPLGVDAAALDSSGAGAAALAAEAVPPPSLDRLWDGSHPAEVSYLIASRSNDRQNFQVVDIDIRLFYRIGLSDAAALAAAYQVDAPGAILRAAAGQLVARLFAGRTLADVIGANRQSIAVDLQQALQDRLDGLSTGIEVVAVVVEAIHPPPQAATAYHGVQAAGIMAESSIEYARADAVARLSEAQQTVLQIEQGATALAAETMETARREALLFEADRGAFDVGGRAFVVERWFERVAQDLPRSRLLIVDHRLDTDQLPAIDLRGADQLRWTPPAEN